MNRKRLILILLIVVLFFTGLYFVIQSLVDKTKSVVRTADLQKAIAAGANPAALGPGDFERMKRTPLGEGWRRNPFFREGENLPPRPVLKAEAAPPAFKPLLTVAAPPPPPRVTVNMIMKVDHTDTRVALLNGRMVREGEPFGNETVARIDPDKVVLQSGDRQRTILMDKYTIPLGVESGGTHAKN